jgi:hypothetical protein
MRLFSIIDKSFIVVLTLQTKGLGLVVFRGLQRSRFSNLKIEG